MPQRLSSPRLVSLVLLTALSTSAMAAPESPLRLGDTNAWREIIDSRSGSRISYPTSVFSERAAEPEGRVLVSPDGNARLLVGSFLNESGVSLDDYRTQILADNYGGAELDYAPRRRTWFVISGTIGAMMFYERVSFSCDGRYINSWAMLYPVAQRKTYDRVVEAIAPTFEPGADRCD